MNQTNKLYDAREYAESKKLPFREAVEWHTIKRLVGDVRGLSVVDAGCGDGIYSRRLIDLGAQRVIGIDGSQDFINQANLKNGGYEGRINYHTGSGTAIKIDIITQYDYGYLILGHPVYGILGSRTIL